METHSSRRDVFVTTKILAPLKTQEETLASMRDSVNKINLDGEFDVSLESSCIPRLDGD